LTRAAVDLDSDYPDWCQSAFICVHLRSSASFRIETTPTCTNLHRSVSETDDEQRTLQKYSCENKRLQAVTMPLRRRLGFDPIAEGFEAFHSAR